MFWFQAFDNLKLADLPSGAAFCQIVMENRQVLTMDEAAVLERARAAPADLVERAGGRVGTPRWSEAHRWRYALAEEGPAP